MDVINMISKVPGLPDAPVVSQDRYQYGGKYFVNGPRLLEFLHEMKEEILSKYDILTVGEPPSVNTQKAIEITNEETGALNMLFQFEHMDIDADRGGESSRRSEKRWSLVELKQIMTRWQKDLENRGWNSIYLNNHDQPRSVSRFGNDDQYRLQSAKLLATFIHMLQGTPYVYQGEEIGMTNVAFESIDEYRDIETLNMYREASAQTFRDVDGLTVTVDVTNTGQMAGKEIVQVYVHDRASGLVRPEKGLKGFAKVALQPGETQSVAIRLDLRAFAYYHPEYKQWITEDGDFDILIASSAADIRCTLPVALESTLDLPCILDRESTIREWMADPRGKAAFGSFYTQMNARTRELFIGEDSEFVGMDLMSMVGDMPLVSVLMWQQDGLPMHPEDLVDGLLVQRWRA